MMEYIEKKQFDEERALYGSHGICVRECLFDGPADGESAFKESSEIKTEKCYFNLRYPFWHDENVEINECEMTTLCRAALWYSSNITVSNSKMHGIKALRECSDVNIIATDIVSTEFGWFSSNINIKDSSAEGEYFMFGARDLDFENVYLKGKYSFQYVDGAVFENCNFDTKDAFWHAKNITVKNSIVKGEYLAWYCENVTFENCVIIGTQPLCYCKGLRLINCEMHEADLSFEKSEVEAEITTPVISIKNASCGRIEVPLVDEIIMNEDYAQCEIIVGGNRYGK